MNKNLCFGMFAAAGLLLATSCSNDELVTVQSGNEAQVTFSLGLEGGLATRAISDGQSADKLVYAVYNADKKLIAASGADKNSQFVKENAFTNLKEAVSLTLAKGQEYTVVFWAQDADCTDYTTTDLTNVQVQYTTNNNDETRDAFYKAETFTVNGDANINVTLTRPFAQINVGVTTEDWNAAYASGVNVTESKVVIRKAATSINLLDGTVDGEAEVINDFATAPVQNGEVLKVDTDNDGVVEEYKWLSMCYILADASKTTLEDMQFTFSPKEGEDILFKDGLTNIPVQRNWRTNILGKILTGDLTFTITIDPGYNDDFNYGNAIKVSTVQTLLEQLEAAVKANKKNIVLDACNADLGGLNYAFKKALVPEDVTVTVRNAKVSSQSYGNQIDGTLIFENCTFNNATGAYSIHFDGGKGHVVFNNCELIGWNTFGSVTVEMNDCAISGNGTYAIVRFYKNSSMTNCTFDGSNANTSDVYADGVSVGGGAVLTMNGCTVKNGVYEYTDGDEEEYDGSYILVDGVRLVNNAATLDAALKNGDKILMENDITVEDGITFEKAVNSINIDGGSHKLTAGQIKTQSVGNFVVSNLTLESTGAGYAIYTMGGTVEFTNVNYNGTKGRAICFYGGGNVTLTNCNITGEIPSPDDYDCTNIWCGNGRVLTVNGGTYGSIFMNASYSWGAMHASSITLNDGTIGKLVLELEQNEDKYISATLTQNGGTITTLVENPQNIDLTGKEKLN